jgi:hypothetical protein
VTQILDSGDPTLYEVTTRGPRPKGKLPLCDELLRHHPCGDAFGMTEDAGMGWNPDLPASTGPGTELVYAASEPPDVAVSPYGTSWHLMALQDRTRFSE